MMNGRILSLIAVALLVVTGFLLWQMGCCHAARLDVGGVHDARIVVIGEVIEVDPERGVAALRIVDDMAHAKPGDVVVVDYSDAEMRDGCDIGFEMGETVAVEAFGPPFENPLKATHVMCRDCGFKLMVGVEAPPIGEPWARVSKE